MINCLKLLIFFLLFIYMVKTKIIKNNDKNNNDENLQTNLLQKSRIFDENTNDLKMFFNKFNIDVDKIKILNLLTFHIFVKLLNSNITMKNI